MSQSSKPTLCVFSNASHCGGGERKVETLFPSVQRRFFLKVVFYENRQHGKNLLRKGALKSQLVHLVSGRRFGLALSIFISMFYLKRIKPEFVLCNTNRGAFIMTLYQYITPRGRRPTVVSLINDFSWKAAGFIFNKLDARFVVPTSYVLQRPNYIPKELKPKIAIIGSPVEIGDEPVLKNEISHHPFIFFPTSFIPCKGLEYGIQAFQFVSHKNCKLVIVGPHSVPEYKQRICALIRELNLDSRIDVIEYRNNINEFYKTCNMVINCTVSDYPGPETFGRTIVEAWTFKKPVVSSECGGPKELIDDGVNGFLVPEKNVLALSRAIDKLMSDPGLRERMGNNGFVKARDNFTEKIVFQKIMQCFGLYPE